MSRSFDIHLDLDGSPLQVGRLWLHSQKGRQAASFEYSRVWLEHSRAFAFEPALPLGPGVFHTGREQAMFRCFADSAPDRWGRVLLKRQEMLSARREGRTARTLQDADFLMLVNDATRHGAFRFTEEGRTSYLASPEPGESIPPLLQLGTLLGAVTRVASNTETEQDLRQVLAPGSSLGGARPKASVLDAKGTLYIAKFPHPHDDWDVPLWEYVAFKLAERVGLRTPELRLEKIGGVNVLLLRRFDREEGRRIPFASAMTLLSANDGDIRSYLEIAEIIQMAGAQPALDLPELWQRMVFNMLIGNVDDHLRNHGFLRERQGWRLSPLYDLEPTPLIHKARVLHTCVSEDDATADPELALTVSDYFGLKTAMARSVLKKMREVVGKWESVARQAGAKGEEIEILRGAFT